MTAQKIKICIESGCKNAQTTKDYCRLHYLKNWKILKEEEQKKAADRLNKYVEGICKKFPEKYVDVIRRDIRSDRTDFVGAPEDGEPGSSEDLYGVGFKDDDGIDRLITKIKLDKDF
jgi:hypothetical protein